MVVSLQETVAELQSHVFGIDIKVGNLSDTSESIGDEVEDLGITVEDHSIRISNVENQIEVLEEDLDRLEDSFDDFKNDTDGPSDGNDNSVRFLTVRLIISNDVGDMVLMTNHYLNHHPYSISLENRFKDLEDKVSAIEERVDFIELQLKSSLKYPGSCQELFDNGKRSDGQEKLEFRLCIAQNCQDAEIQFR